MTTMSATTSQSAATARRPRRFLPGDFVLDQREKISPWAEQLRAREINSPAALEQWLLDVSELASVVDEYGSRRYIDKSCHTDDAQIKQRFLDYVENIEPKLKPVMFELQKKFLASEHAGKLSGPRYEILKKKWQADVDIFREENVPLETEITKIVTQYDEVCGDMMVWFDGKEYTMQQMARFQEETDRALRERAWRAATDRRLADRDRIDDLFDKVLPMRQRIAENAGFKNYRDYQFKALKRFDYTAEDCDAFAAAVEKHVVPLMRDLDAQRRKALAVDNLRPWDLAVDPTLYRIYNRHLTQGLLLPDDRDDPKLEFFHGSDLGGVRFEPAGALGLASLVWPRGQQNVMVRGVFGYTEPDGSPTGSTPTLIRQVTKLLVMRDLPRLTDLDRREDAQRRWRLTSERTRDQAYTLEALKLQGAFTGDPEIDNILVAFVRPADLGAA